MVQLSIEQLAKEAKLVWQTGNYDSVSDFFAVHPEYEPVAKLFLDNNPDDDSTDEEDATLSSAQSYGSGPMIVSREAPVY